MKLSMVTVLLSFVLIGYQRMTAAPQIEEYVFDENGIYLNNTGALPAGCGNPPAEELCATVYAPSQVELVFGTYRPKSPTPPVPGYPKIFMHDSEG